MAENGTKTLRDSFSGSAEKYSEADPSCSNSKNDDRSTAHMKRQIGLPGAIAIIVGTMIGSGIFITPTGLLKKADSVATSLVIWALCGLLSTLTALCYVELGTLVPRSGGEHAYFMDAYTPLHPFWGEVPAFLFAWMSVMFIRPCNIAIAALSFGKYTIEPLIKTTGIVVEWKRSEEYDWAVKLLAAVIVCLIGFVNILSANVGMRVQIIFTIGKIFAMVILIGVGAYNVSIGQYGGIPMEYDHGNSTYGDIATAFYSGLFAYDGWNTLNFLVEEVVNPKKNLPLAIFLGIGSTTTLYLLINIAYLSALDKDGIISSTAVAVDVGDSVLGSFKYIIPLLITLATIGSVNAAMYANGRIAYVASRDGHLPDVVSYVNVKFLTPTVAISLQMGLAFLLIGGSSTVIQLINFGSFLMWIFHVLALGALLVFRYTKPNVHRQIKVPLVLPIFVIIIAVALIVTPIVDKPEVEYLFVLGFASIGMIFYYFFVHPKRTSAFGTKLTRGIQCLTQTVPSPYKEE